MNAVKPIKDLHQVQLQDELRVAADPANVRPLDYVQYRALLVARAAIQPYSVYAAQQQCPRYSNRPWIPPEIWTMLLQQHPDLLTAWNQFDWNKAPANGAINNR